MNANHQICSGCEAGATKAASIDSLNASTAQIAERLRADAVDRASILRREATLMGTGMTTNAARRALAAAASQAEGLLHANVADFTAEHPQQRVVCAQAGPTGWLKHCGACVINA